MSENQLSVESVEIVHHKAQRSYDVIMATINGIVFKCDCVNERQVQLARKLAYSHNAKFRIEPGDWSEKGENETFVRCDVIDLRISRIVTSYSRLALKIVIADLHLHAVDTDNLLELGRKFEGITGIELYVHPTIMPELENADGHSLCC